MSTVRLYEGDCLDVLRTFPDNSIDAVVTDPPYGLSNTSPDKVAETLAAWVTGDREHVPGGRGFMGATWDAFVPPPAVWDEVHRVLKPGGHALVFAGARTQDLMGVSLRLAGFDLRDSVAWLYGSGFPKSLDVSKAIDKTGGASPTTQAAILREARLRAGMTREEVAEVVGCTVSSIRDWEDGRARSKGREVEYITPSPGYRSKLADLLGYSEDERRTVGVSTDRRGDGTVIGLGHSGVQYGGPTTDAAKKWEGWGTSLKPGHEPIILARKPLEGTVADNVTTWGTGALNIDATRIGMSDADRKAARVPMVNAEGGMWNQLGSGREGRNGEVFEPHTGGRWPANVVLDPDTAKALDQQSGFSKSPTSTGRGAGGQNGMYSPIGAQGKVSAPGDEGGASRFFRVVEPDPPFMYTAKAPKRERPNVDGVQHPTVKPLKLIEYLVTLITPPGGTVLDLFGGSGTTAEAAIRVGRDCIIIEAHAPYIPLIRQRVDRATTTKAGTE